MSETAIDPDRIKNKMAFRSKVASISKGAFAGKDMEVKLKKGGYQARSIKGVLDVIMPLMEQNNLDVQCVHIQPVHSGETHFKAIFTWEWIDLDTGYSEITQSAGSGLDLSDKDTGKAQTYALKYAFTTMFKMDSGDDADNKSSEMTIKDTLAGLDEMLRTMWEEGFFIAGAADPNIPEEEVNKIASANYQAIYREISNHKHNAAWLTKKAHELAGQFRNYRGSKG